jgi:hypothetical protein
MSIALRPPKLKESFLVSSNGMDEILRTHCGNIQEMQIA